LIFDKVREVLQLDFGIEGKPLVDLKLRNADMKFRQRGIIASGHGIGMREIPFELNHVVGIVQDSTRDHPPEEVRATFLIQSTGLARRSVVRYEDLSIRLNRQMDVGTSKPSHIGQGEGTLAAKRIELFQPGVVLG
jgi:hypothetical protein